MRNRDRKWCFTLNNYTEEEYEAVISLKDSVDYLVVGKEVGDGGTPHLQGFIYMRTQVAFKSMKKLLPRAHLEPAKGSPQQASTYCKKEGDFSEYGSCPTQGRRTDIDEVVTMVKGGASMQQIAEVAGMQSLRHAETVMKYFEQKRAWKPEVRWYYGESGAGKSRSAYEWLPDAYSPTTMKWWDGYDAHEDVILDDFRGDQCPFAYLLRILDRYPMRIECKGGSRQLLVRRIAVTSISHPRDLDWGKCDEPVEQLLRRIDEIICVTKSNAETQGYHNVETREADEEII